MLCWSCSKIKGKRACPAHAGEGICSRCCGTKRRVEIRCPEDCPYLHGDHDSRWESPSRKAEETQFIAHFAQVGRGEVPLLVFLHHLLLQAQQNFGGPLSDEAASDVVSTLARTFETFSKGIVYEHKSDSPHLQGVVRWVRTVLERRHEIPEIPRASDGEILKMLQTIASAIASHREEETVRRYLDTAERVFRASLARAPTIEVPGETEESGGGLIV